MKWLRCLGLSPPAANALNDSAMVFATSTPGLLQARNGKPSGPGAVLPPQRPTTTGMRPLRFVPLAHVLLRATLVERRPTVRPMAGSVRVPPRADKQDCGTCVASTAIVSVHGTTVNHGDATREHPSTLRHTAGIAIRRNTRAGCNARRQTATALVVVLWMS